MYRNKTVFIYYYTPESVFYTIKELIYPFSVAVRIMFVALVLSINNAIYSCIYIIESQNHLFYSTRGFITSSGETALLSSYTFKKFSRAALDK